MIDLDSIAEYVNTEVNKRLKAEGCVITTIPEITKVVIDEYNKLVIKSYLGEDTGDTNEC